MKTGNTILKMTAVLTALATALVALHPRQAYAGDEEWATAGKILTGVVASHILTKGLPEPPRPRLTITRTQVNRRGYGRGRHRTRSKTVCRPARTKHTRDLSVVVRIGGDDDHGRRHSSRSGRHRSGRCERRHRHTRYCRGYRGATIHYIGRNRRILKPRAPGRPVLVQVRRGRCGDWRTVRVIHRHCRRW